jgi:hypothetical protein
MFFYRLEIIYSVQHSFGDKKMHLKHAPHYTINFPSRKTIISPLNDQDANKILKILNSAEIEFTTKEAKFHMKGNLLYALTKIKKYIVESQRSKNSLSNLAKILKRDLQTICLLKKL